MPLDRRTLGASLAALLFAAGFGSARAQPAQRQQEQIIEQMRQRRAMIAIDAARAAAQQAAQAQQPGVDPKSFEGKDSTEGVYVRDSALAQEKFALAQKMERLKEWNKSADLYQEILEKYADRVVASRVDKDQRIYQYISVTKGVQDALSAWPEEGRNVYRARYEAVPINAAIRPVIPLSRRWEKNSSASRWVQRSVMSMASPVRPTPDNCSRSAERRSTSDLPSSREGLSRSAASPAKRA